MFDNLNQDEILRYLGYKDSVLTDRILSLLDKCISQTLSVMEPKWIYRRMPMHVSEDGVWIGETAGEYEEVGSHRISAVCLEGEDIKNHLKNCQEVYLMCATEDGVWIGETAGEYEEVGSHRISAVCLEGEDIKNHLKNCQEVYLMCATIGVKMDRLIRTKMVREPDAGVVFDACGIQAVEQLADMVEKEIETIVSEEGFHLTWRYSPGYGDLPLESQRDFIRLLDTHRRIGVSLSDSFLMSPSKSVTAILGVSDTKKDPRSNKCDFCNNRQHCSFRKGGKTC